MKKTFFIALLAMVGLGKVNAQDSNYGVIGGFTSGTSKVKVQSGSGSASESGFHVGFFGDFNVSENFNIQPQIMYTNIQEVNLLQIPVLAKFGVGEDFNLLVGPQVTYTLEEIQPDFTKFNLGLSFGASYDIKENFFVQANYTAQINNYYTGSLDIKSRLNFFKL
jgi:opacity protein-like surface antigen